MLSIEGLSVQSQAVDWCQAWDTLYWPFLSFGSALRLLLELGEETLLHIVEKVETHVVDHLGEPVGALVAGWRQVHLDDPGTQ